MGVQVGYLVLTLLELYVLVFTVGPNKALHLLHPLLQSTYWTDALLLSYIDGHQFVLILIEDILIDGLLLTSDLQCAVLMPTYEVVLEVLLSGW